MIRSVKRSVSSVFAPSVATLSVLVALTSATAHAQVIAVDPKKPADESPAVYNPKLSLPKVKVSIASSPILRTRGSIDLQGGLATIGSGTSGRYAEGSAGRQVGLWGHEDKAGRLPDIAVKTKYEITVIPSLHKAIGKVSTQAGYSTYNHEEQYSKETSSVLGLPTRVSGSLTEREDGSKSRHEISVSGADLFHLNTVTKSVVKVPAVSTVSADDGTIPKKTADALFYMTLGFRIEGIQRLVSQKRVTPESAAKVIAALEADTSEWKIDDVINFPMPASVKKKIAELEIVQKDEVERIVNTSALNRTAACEGSIFYCQIPYPRDFVKGVEDMVNAAEVRNRIAIDQVSAPVHAVDGSALRVSYQNIEDTNFGYRQNAARAALGNVSVDHGFSVNGLPMHYCGAIEAVYAILGDETVQGVSVRDRMEAAGQSRKSYDPRFSAAGCLGVGNKKIRMDFVGGYDGSYSQGREQGHLGTSYGGVKLERRLLGPVNVSANFRYQVDRIPGLAPIRTRRLGIGISAF